MNNHNNETNSEIIKATREFRDAMTVETAFIDIAKMLSRSADRLDVTTAALREKTKQCDALAAESAALKQSKPSLKSMMSALEAFYLAEEVPENAMLMAFNILRGGIETPTTDAALAEIRNEARASAIPDGYTLVPQQIFLEPSDIESICSQCGDGHEKGYGDFADGLLWVGNIQKDDGSIVHGLHISTADYSEEGGLTICEFAELRKESGQ